MHGFCICEFTYELNFIHNPQVPICGAFVIICGHGQSSKNHERPDVVFPGRLTKLRLCLLVSSLTVNECPFDGPFRPTFSTVLCFLLILLFNMAPEHSMMCRLAFLCARGLWGV